MGGCAGLAGGRAGQMAGAAGRVGKRAGRWACGWVGRRAASGRIGDRQAAEWAGGTKWRGRACGWVGGLVGRWVSGQVIVFVPSKLTLVAVLKPRNSEKNRQKT